MARTDFCSLDDPVVRWANQAWWDRCMANYRKSGGTLSEDEVKVVLNGVSTSFEHQADHQFE